MARNTDSGGAVPRRHDALEVGDREWSIDEQLEQRPQDRASRQYAFPPRLSRYSCLSFELGMTRSLEPMEAAMTESTDQPCIHTLTATAIGPKEPSVPGNGLKSELTEINHDQVDSPQDCVEVASEDSFPACDPPSWIPIIGIG